MDNEPNGLGMETHSTGDKYVGEYKGIKWHGLGTYTFANGDKYVGEFKDDKRNGQGTFTFADGDKYVGESKDDKRNGQGTYTFANGNKYVGEFKNDKRNGQGTFTFADGDKYVGEFKNDLYHGRGIIYRANGSVEESGIYQNDKLIKAEYVDPNSFSRIVKGAHHVDTKQDDDPNQGKKNDSRHELDAEPSARKVVTPDADNHRWKFNYYALEKPLLSNVAGSRKVMQVTLTIMTHYDDRVIKNVKVHELALRAGILDVMRQKTEADLRKPDFRKALAEEVRLIINSLLEKYEGFGGIEEVTFTEFVVQQPS
jgi:flagellar basal body-associated protein FliL